MTSPVQPMGAYIRQAAAEEPDRTVVTLGDTSMSWAVLDGTSDRLAGVLRGNGVRPGSSVSIILPNGMSYIVALAAAWKLGATPQLISPRMPVIELQQLLELARPTAIVAIADIDALVPVVHPGESAEAVTVAAGEEPAAVSQPWAAFSTGGSTGRPKLVLAELPGLVGPGTDMDHVIRGYDLGREGVMLIPGPLCHAGPFGMAMGTFFSRGRIVLLDRFDPEAALAAIEREQVRDLFVVPTMMNRIMKLDPEVRRRYDVSSLRTVRHAASPCPPWLKQAWIDWLGPERIVEWYSASDAAGITRIDGTEWLAHRGSVGRPVIGDLEIRDEAGRRLPAGEVGDIYMRPPLGAMQRTYIGAEPPQAPDGWWSVGDMGWVDADGYLFLADRRVDLIITGGLNVYPAEVEGVLDSHPLVVSSAVVGLPDDDLGKRLHAVVQVAAPLEIAELTEFVRQRLLPYKVPRTFELRAEPVRDEAGKVRRSSLAAEVIAKRG
jgi:bile acid-coenzyme A ligase